MTTEVLTFNLLAGVQATAGQGRVWYIKSATAALNITLDTSRSGASVRKFLNVGAGFKYSAKEDERWTYMRITSAVNQVVELVVGDDDVEVANAVTVSGGVAISETPSAAIADTAAVALPNAATTAIVAANPARRRVTIGNVSTALGSFFIRAGALANNLLEVQPGTFVELRTTAALSGRNDSGGALSALVMEET